MDTLLEAMDILLDPRLASTNPLRTLYRRIDSAVLREALDNCREFKRLEEHGYQDELRARHSHLSRYLPAFLELPFCGEPGTEKLLAGVKLARILHAGGRQELLPDSASGFRARQVGSLGEATARPSRPTVVGSRSRLGYS